MRPSPVAQRPFAEPCPAQALPPRRRPERRSQPQLRRAARCAALGACGLAFAAALPAQLPAHAVRLDPTTPLGDVTIVQTGDAVHALAPAAGAWATHYGRSPDGGRSWPVLQQVIGRFGFDRVAAQGDVIAVSGWSASGTPWVAISLDLGQTWPISQPVTTAMVTWAPSGRESVVHVADRTIVVAWIDLWTGSLWARRSPDGGVTWPGGDVLVAQSVVPLWSFVSRSELQLVGDGPTLHLFWLDVSAASGLVVSQQSSFDAGATWLPATRTIPLLPLPIYPSQWTTAAGNADHLLLATIDGQLRRSTNAGATWTAAAGVGIDEVADLAVDGPVAVAVGTVASPSPPTWVVNVSTDHGQTWQPNPLTIDTFPGFSGRVHAVGGTVYAHFPHSSQPAASTIALSHDFGATWRVLEAGVRGFFPGPRRTIHVRQTTTGGAFAYVGLGHTTRGSGTAGTGGAVPALTMQGLPALGQGPAFAVDAARGGALGLLALSSEPPLPTPFAGGLVWLSGQLATRAFVTGGAVGAPGAGAWSSPVTVPNVPALAGTSVTAQALLIDPAGRGGFALTNAIEVWLR